jgi:hypothetical protein
MAWKKLGGLAALSLAFVFGACGDDSSSGADSGSKQREVSTIYDLGACTADREGDSVYVIEKKSDYLCQKGEWIELDAENNPNSSSSAKSEPSSSSANSKNSSSSEEPDTLWIIKNKTISGYAQKGPFEKGSEVVLYELDSTTLKQTGRSFEGKVESDDGKFSIKKTRTLLVLVRTLGVPLAAQAEVTPIGRTVAIHRAFAAERKAIGALHVDQGREVLAPFSLDARHLDGEVVDVLTA